MIDIKEIQKQFNLVISHSQWIEDVHSDEIFEKWAKNKARFIEKWGGLTYELDEEITFDMSEEDKKICFNDYVSDILMFTNKPAEAREFFSKISIEDFYKNRVGVKFEVENIKISAEAKLSKSLKFFFEDKFGLDKFQTRLSRMIQDCKITGKMVMSVHPLDFLSSSETAHNWHSCHALDGEYRAGNLSYMQDSHTFMIYLKANGEYVLPNFPEEVRWNSKKWRVLMYMGVDENIIISGRQYPFSNQIALDIATKELINRFYDLDSLCEWTLIPETIDDIMEDGIGALQYNDCLNSPSYVPIAMYTKEVAEEVNNESFDRLIIGEYVTCLECGSDHVNLSDDFRCDSCGGYTYCEHCGDACHEDDMYWLEGELVCYGCWDANGIFCEGCEETFNEFKTEMYYDEETDSYYCEECYNSLIDNRETRMEISTEGEL